MNDTDSRQRYGMPAVMVTLDSGDIVNISSIECITRDDGTNVYGIHLMSNRWVNATRADVDRILEACTRHDAG